MNKVCISLGWNCHSAVHSVNTGLRIRKSDGYNTCPFDEMVTNHDGIVQCLLDDFKYFCDETNLQLNYIQGDDTIYNTKYNFIYNHESPGHANLYITQNWAEGINHYVNNNYYNFKRRYEKRVNNFRNYLSDPNNYIIFVITSWNKTQDDMADLKNAIETHYPNLKYEIQILNDPNGKEYYVKHMNYMGYTENDHELKRLL
jgi:hypothetical protein